MTMQIKMYELAPPFKIRTHAGAVYRKGMIIGKQVFVFLEVDTDAPLVDKTFSVAPCDVDIPQHVEKYLDTMQSVDPAEGKLYIFHVFEDKQGAFVFQA